MRWRPAFWLVAALVVGLDQATKQWALQALELYEQHEVIGDFLSLQLVFNSGAAFSLGADYTWIVSIVMVAITGGIIWYARRAQSRLAIALLGIGLGGAVGNLIDRLFREPSFGQGHVIDMINYNNWFVGNVADIAIVGVALVILAMSFRGQGLLAPAPAAKTDTVPETEALPDADAAPETTQTPVETRASAVDESPHSTEQRG